MFTQSGNDNVKDENEALDYDEELALRQRKTELAEQLRDRKQIQKDQKPIFDKFKTIKSKINDTSYNLLKGSGRKDFLELINEMYKYVKKQEGKKRGLLSKVGHKIGDKLKNTTFVDYVQTPIIDFTNGLDKYFNSIVRLEDGSEDQKNFTLECMKWAQAQSKIVQLSVKKYIQYRYKKDNPGKEAVEDMKNIQDYEEVFLKVLFSIAGVRSISNKRLPSHPGIFDRFVFNTVKHLKGTYLPPESR